jgi:hypothetical protein
MAQPASDRSINFDLPLGAKNRLRQSDFQTHNGIIASGLPRYRPARAPAPALGKEGVKEVLEPKWDPACSATSASETASTSESGETSKTGSGAKSAAAWGGGVKTHVILAAVFGIA